MWELRERDEIFNEYIDNKYPGIDKESEPFKNYLESVEYILEHSNFIMFPTQMETNKSKDDTKSKRIFHCDLVVSDMNYWQWIQWFNIRFDYSSLQTFEALRTFLETQAPLIKIEINKRDKKEDFREHFRLGLLAWFEAIFWLDTTMYVWHVGFEPEDDCEFIFSNGTLNVETQEFSPWKNVLQQCKEIKINFPYEKAESLTLGECLPSMYSLKKYISLNNTISSITVWYLVNWIFRDEYKTIHWEYPFLGIQAVTSSGKTSILNCISRISGYDTETIGWTWDSPFASLAGMNYTGKRFYFFDEFQQLTNWQQKFIQSAYNSGKSYKGWGKDYWWDMVEFNKDCNLICSGENITTDNEALLNRFIILNSKEPFLIVMNVRDEEEFKKYEELSGEKVKADYLNTDEIRFLAKEYYRPRYLNILKHKRDINYREYHDKATKLIDEVVKNISVDIRPGVRIQNNLIPAITWYLMVCWDAVNTNEVYSIIEEYFSEYMKFRKGVFVSWRVVNYIVENPWLFCDWLPRVKSNLEFPMIYLKHTKKQEWLIMQISKISHFAGKGLGLSVDWTVIEPQLRNFLWIPDIPSKANKVAKGLSSNMWWVFIPLRIVENNEQLKRIRDVTLDYLSGQVRGLEKMKTEGQIYAMSDETLGALIEEINSTYENAEFFNTETFSKEDTEVEETD